MSVFFEVFQIHIRDSPADFERGLLHFQPLEARAVPFAPVAVAAEVEPPDPRVAVVAFCEGFYEFFVGLEINRVGEIGDNVVGRFRSVGEFVFYALVVVALCALQKEPFGRRIFFPRMEVRRHYSEIERQAFFGKTVDVLFEPLPINRILRRLESRPVVADIPRPAKEPVVGRVRAVRRPALSGVLEGVFIFLKFDAVRPRKYARNGE